jgi:hypothetical protein
MANGGGMTTPARQMTDLLWDDSNHAVLGLRDPGVMIFPTETIG